MNGGQVRRVLRRAGVTRRRAANLRMCCERPLLATKNRGRSRRSRILCYHSVGTPEWGVNDVSPRRFARQAELALADGWRFVPATELATDPGEGKLAVTFDDGIASVLHNAAPILREYRIPWTMFAVTGWTDGDHEWGPGTVLGWRDLERLAGDGVEIGSHSVSHPDFGRLDPVRAADELGASRRTIEDRIGVPVTSFAIPFGQSGNWTAAAQAAATDAGYTAIFAQSEVRRPAGTVARTFITRFDGDRVFRAALGGAFDRWEEWL